MSEHPFISIIVPTYNRAHLITKTLESLLNQSYTNYEIIIVDDGSTDNTEEVVKKYLSETVYYYKQDNAERSAARNYGTKHAKGKYINWFDSDDIALNNHIEEALTVIKNKSPEWFHLAYNYSNQKKLFDVKIQVSTRMLIEGNCLSCNGVFVRKDIALLNSFNEKFFAGEDYELWLRLAAQYKLVVNNTITSTIIQHDERSVLMSNPDKLIKRFETFIKSTSENELIVNFLGNKLPFFKMKNYLLLAVDLAANNHKSKAFYYLRKAISFSPKFLVEKTFYATIKHILFQNR